MIFLVVVVAYKSALGLLLRKEKNEAYILDVHVSMKLMVADLVQ